jgi:3-hydroxyacyl-CoA dehydrogenase
MLNEKMKLISVVGAGGKMGAGIALLLLQEMARTEAEETGNVGHGDFRLVLIDANETALNNLILPLKSQLIKYAEQSINQIRKYFHANPRLIDNKDMVDYFVNGAMNIIQLTTNIDDACDSTMIFEAIVEDEKIKINLFKKLASLNKEAYYFTNTSSIPIDVLSSQGNLNNRLIGFHFYNPPAVQKLVEIIVFDEVVTELRDLAQELAKRLEKIVVVSNNVAGFIGNGYFMREMLFAFEKVKELSLIYTQPNAIYIINKVTQDYLIRPMGIFQLIDYVGLDVCQNICKTMEAHLTTESFQNDLLDSMIRQKILGGQNADGSQKNGFFQYEGQKRIGVYSLNEHRYLPLKEVQWVSECDKELGPLPKELVSWKNMQRDVEKDVKIKNYFKNLNQENSLGATLAKEFLIKSIEITKMLVDTQVAYHSEDVATVLKNGFFHLYSPTFLELTLRKMIGISTEPKPRG